MPNMDEYERMLAGEWIRADHPQIVRLNNECTRRCREFAATGTDDEAAWRRALAALLPNAHPSAVVKPPFRCDFGTAIYLAEDVFINYNCTFLDGAPIRIGARTLVGPDCGFYTPCHPLDPVERRKHIERTRSITIGEDCWIGGGVTIRPGVTIGSRVIVAAGSVVVHDVPDDAVVAGNPAVVKRLATTSRPGLRPREG